jgi:hypothetical protein
MRIDAGGIDGEEKKAHVWIHGGKRSAARRRMQSRLPGADVDNPPLHFRFDHDDFQ